MKNEPCVPFPLNWARNVDFVPLISLQAKLNKEQELFFFEGRVSVGRSTPREPITTDLGITIGPSNVIRNAVDVSHGSPNPRNDNWLPQSEIWENIKEYMPEIPDVAIHTKGIIHDVPLNVMSEEPLDGADYLFQQQSAIGNRYRRIRQQTSIPVINPHNIVRNGLYEHGVIKPGDPCLRRIRSVLATDYILPSNNRGYNILHPLIFKIERGLRGKTKDVTTGKNWWEDTARPYYLGGRIDSTELNIRICQLDDRRQLIGI